LETGVPNGEAITKQITTIAYTPTFNPRWFGTNQTNIIVPWFTITAHTTTQMMLP
jgi:hypothetical protein